MLRNTETGKWGVRLAGGAILLAPFIALLYRPEAGLIVMAIALGATSLLLHGALDAVPPRARRRLRMVMAFNGCLIVACLALAVWLVVRG